MFRQPFAPLPHLSIGETRWQEKVSSSQSVFCRSLVFQLSLTLHQAKGYPDIQTRQFLNVLSTHYPHIPIFALVDFDPDGLGIASTYKHGSINLAHEANLAVPCIQWLGVRSQDFLGPQQEKDAQGMLKLTARDRRIATRMLANEDVFGERGIEVEWRREIQTMLMLNVKAEIQILGNLEALGNWLDEKLIDAIGDI